MSDDKKADLGLDESKPEPAKNPEKEPSQEALDWKEIIQTEEYRKNPSIMKFKTADDLAKSYIHLHKKLGNAADFALQDKHNYDTAKKAMSALFPKKELAGEVHEVVKKFHDEYSLPNPIVEKMDKDLKSHLEKTNKETQAAKLHSYKDELKKVNTDGKLEQYLEVGLDNIGMSFEELKNTLGNEAFNPKIIKKLAAFGRNSMSDKHIEINEGGTGGLPSNMGDLTNLMNQLTQQKVMAVNPAEQRELTNQLADVKAKIAKIKGEKPKGAFS